MGYSDCIGAAISIPCDRFIHTFDGLDSTLRVEGCETSALSSRVPMSGQTGAVRGGGSRRSPTLSVENMAFEPPHLLRRSSPSRENPSLLSINGRRMVKFKFDSRLFTSQMCLLRAVPHPRQRLSHRRRSEEEPLKISEGESRAISEGDQTVIGTGRRGRSDLAFSGYRRIEV
jgi:hypothetical protein